MDAGAPVAEEKSAPVDAHTHPENGAGDVSSTAPVRPEPSQAARPEPVPAGGSESNFPSWQ
jgi:hypothetical protein